MTFIEEPKGSITPIQELPLPREKRKKIRNAPETYQDSLIVEKARTKRAFVFDRDGFMQPNTVPLKNPPSKLIAAGEDLVRRIKPYVNMQCSAQVIDLAADSKTRSRSIKYGFDRPPPYIKLPDGGVTSDPGDIPEWKPLCNPDAFVGFGSRIDVLNKEGAYVQDKAFDEALGGPQWRPNAEKLLLKMYPDGSIFKRLGRVDIEGEYPNNVDVDRLPYRFQVEDYGPEGLRQKDELMLRFEIANLRGYDMVAVDETSLKKNRYVTYITPRGATKERGVGRVFRQLEVYSGVKTEDYEEIVMGGDTLTDFHLGMYGLPQARNVTFILAADSELSEPLRDGHRAFANLQLIWSRQHPEMRPRYEPTGVPGVFKFRAHRLMPWRTVILAHYAPWSKGLNCVESVLACVDHLGYH